MSVVVERVDLLAITADGGPGSEASADVERSIADLLRVVRDLLDLDVAFVGAYCREERRFGPVPTAARAMPSALTAAACFGIELGEPIGEQVVSAPVQYQGEIHYGTLYGFSRSPGRALDLQGAKRLKIAAQSTARLLARADGHDIAVDSAMALRSPLVNRM